MLADLSDYRGCSTVLFAAALPPCFNSPSRGLQGKRQCFPWNARYKRADQPAESGRNIARKRCHLALHVDSAVALLHPPPRFHLPQKAVVVALRFFPLVVAAGVFHLRNTHG